MSGAIATNKKAYRDYFFSDKWECGIELKGGEVKSFEDKKKPDEAVSATAEKPPVPTTNRLNL